MISIRAPRDAAPTPAARESLGPRNPGQGQGQEQGQGQGQEQGQEQGQGQGTGSGIRVRALEWTDLKTLASLEQDLFADDAWSIATWWAELAGRPRRDYVVAVDATGDIVGYAGLDLAGAVADIMTIATAPACQGRGIGRLLLDALISRAAEHRVEAIMLEVRADNAAARNLYQRNGFDVISVRRRYYQPGDVDALVMRRLMKEGHG